MRTIFLVRPRALACGGGQPCAHTGQTHRVHIQCTFRANTEQHTEQTHRTHTGQIQSNTEETHRAHKCTHRAHSGHTQSKHTGHIQGTQGVAQGPGWCVSPMPQSLRAYSTTHVWWCVPPMPHPCMLVALCSVHALPAAQVLVASEPTALGCKVPVHVVQVPLSMPMLGFQVV